MKSCLSPSLMFIGLMLAAACSSQDPGSRKAGPPSGPPPEQAPSEVGLLSSLPQPVPSDDLLKSTFFTFNGQPPMLPAWKTEWEQNLERLMGEWKHLGLPFADSATDYRNNNPALFYITKPPKSTAFRTPAEYEPSQAYLLNWYSGYTDTAWVQLFSDIIQGAWRVVPVIMIYSTASQRSWIELQLKSLGYSAADLAKNMVWWQQKSNAIWARDYGPVSIVETGSTGSEKLSFIDYKYYHGRPYDDEIPTQLAKVWGVNVFRPDLSFEGGNFQTTSDGLCSATKGVLGYNLQLSQSAIEQILKDYQGCKNVLMPAPMTGGVIAHIDMFSKFGDDDKMMMGEYTSTQSAANKAILDANAALFAATKTPSGKTITVTRIPMPNIGSLLGYSIWRTYTNALSLSNGTQKVVLIPTYSDETSTEKAALAAYAKVFPGYKLVKVDSKVIIPGQGAVHCITMQIPKAVKAMMEAPPGNQCGTKNWSCYPSSCGTITSKGCCDGDILKYCNNGKLAAKDCSGTPKCGFDKSKGWYECNTNGAGDPSGTLPLKCPTATTDAGPSSDLSLDLGQPPDTGVKDLGPSLEAGPACGSVTIEGCCDGTTLKYCVSGKIFTQTCSQPSCGWDTTTGWYQCGTSGTADPSGTYPLPCPGAKPDAGPDKSKPDLAPDKAKPDLPPADRGQPDAEVSGSEDDGGCTIPGRIPAPFGSSLLLLLGVLVLRRRSV